MQILRGLISLQQLSAADPTGAAARERQEAVASPACVQVLGAHPSSPRPGSSPHPDSNPHLTRSLIPNPALALDPRPRPEQALEALRRTLATSTPGGEPQNAEAKRQLLFFCNSLRNRWLPEPRPVRHMHPFSSFTPHYAEDVSYSFDALKSVGDEGVNLESLLQARACTSCISATPSRLPSSPAPAAPAAASAPP